MTPIKILTPDGYWVGVGDWVYTTRPYGWSVKRGLIESFDREDEIANLVYQINDTTQGRMNVEFDHIFGVENGAWLDGLEVLENEAEVVKRKLREINHQIEAVREAIRGLNP